MLLLNDIEIFYHVIEQKSFSKAAERLGYSKSFISKRITKLEKELKIRLISRTTHKLSLTEAGRKLYLSSLKIIDESERAFSMLGELQDKPSGLLRISVPPALGLNLLAPFIPQFLKKFPEVNVEMQLETHVVNLVQDGYDLALRSAKLESSNLIARKICQINYGIYATSQYLSDKKMLSTPSDLIFHNCASYTNSISPREITFIKDKKKATVFFKSNFTSNHLDLIKKMVMNDVCVGFLPDFMVLEEVKANQLIQCLPNYRLASSSLYAIYPEREFNLLKLTYFLSMLQEFLMKTKFNF